MGLWGTIIGGIIGSVLGGHWFIGGIIGNIVGDKLCDGGEEDMGYTRSSKGNTANSYASRQTEETSYEIKRLLFRCMGKLAKADGHVSEDEIHFVSGVMQQWHLPRNQRIYFQEQFRIGRDTTRSFEELVADFAQFCDRHGTGLQLNIQAIQIFCVLALADGEVSKREMEMLYAAERILQVRGTVNQFFAEQRAENNNETHVKADELAESYKCLGVSPDATDSEIKHAWRTLVKKYHPDRLNNSDLSQDFKDYATRKTQEINAAYETICSARGTA